METTNFEAHNKVKGMERQEKNKRRRSSMALLRGTGLMISLLQFKVVRLAACRGSQVTFEVNMSSYPPQYLPFNN